ncbi:DNA-processing protein DprA [Beijerinckia sp. GAS462]|uniref:DNA-processing protein DprA n=1 Tax=Beijerinckia sp. GAS462 TaxID=3039852 RepID=UPI00247AA6D5|nr:DNA-processing protein DprA [Beijerinckia sp. GAS462]
MLDWLQLTRSDNIGPRTFQSLLQRFGSATAALNALPRLIAKQSGARAIRLAVREDCERELDMLRRKGGQFLTLDDSAYPQALRAIDAPPPVIAVLGNLDVLARPMVAIVGSRNASVYGAKFATATAQELGEAGFVIASGLARGIDESAHRASLATGTVAVLAGGLDKIYPAENVPLAEAMCERGAVISEMPLAWVPRGRDFPRRNRIVSGLALGTVVVEAARRSGSLITARYANEQGREVFAVPGSPFDPRAEGTNDLLRQGATLCTRSADVIEALEPLMVTGPQRQGAQAASDEDAPDLFEAIAPRDGADETVSQQPLAPAFARSVVPQDFVERLRALLGPSPVSIDDLVRVTGRPVAEVQAAILELDLQGAIGRQGGNRITLMP